MISQPAHADSYAGCIAGRDRYNMHIGKFDYWSDRLGNYKFGSDGFDAVYKKRVEQCNKIAPSIGYASCERFLKSGGGSPAKRQWASQVAARLRNVYRECQAQ